MEIRFNETDPMWDIDKFRSVISEIFYGKVEGEREITISLPRKHMEHVSSAIRKQAGMSVVVNSDEFKAEEKVNFEHFTSTETGLVHFKEIPEWRFVNRVPNTKVWEEDGQIIVDTI